jgi:diguanylate cyclase (GGDEF)-like protein
VSELDPRSLIFVAGLLGLLCLAILFMMRRSFPPTIGGLVYWSRGLFGMVVASGLFGLTGVIPEFFCVVLANTMLVAGIMSFYAGFRHFAGMPIRARTMGIVLAMLTCYVAWFTYVDNNYPARAMLVTLTDTVLFYACTLLVARTSGNTIAGRFTCLVFAAIGTISLVRAGMLAAALDTPSDVLGATFTQKAYLAAMAFSVLAITLGAMMLANERLRTALEFIASHDQLTDAFARTAFIELLTKEVSRSHRNGQPIALLMFDLDNFKAINDRFGHVTGDRVIIDFVQRTREMLRNIDSIGRYGGEEFVALLPETTIDEARAIAERVCKGIAAGTSSDLPPYTVSVGVSGASNGCAEANTLLSKADEALYRAKENGRNRVEISEEEVRPARMHG